MPSQEVDSFVEKAYAAPPTAPTLSPPQVKPRRSSLQEPQATHGQSPQREDHSAMLQRHLAPLQVAQNEARNRPALTASAGPGLHQHHQGDLRASQPAVSAVPNDARSASEDRSAQKNRPRGGSNDFDVVPLVAPGSIRLIIEAATALKAGDITGKSDPYCQVEVGGMKYKTPKVVQTLNPTWNYTIPLPSATTKTHLYLEVWDWDAIGSHDFLGVIEEDIDTTHDATCSFPLQGRPGKKDKKITGFVTVSVKR